MGLICRELLKLATLKNLKLVAGANGLEKTIRWVYTVECFEDNREIVDWLHGGELVLITGRDIKNNDALLIDLIQKIYENNVSGLLINIGAYISAIPEKAVELADKLGFPIFTIPWETRIVDVTREVCGAIITKEAEEKSIDNLLENILFGDMLEDDNLIDRAAYYGYDLTGQCMMCVADINHFAEYLKQHNIKDESNVLEIKTNFKRIVSEILLRNNKKALIMLRSDSVLMLVKSQTNDLEALKTIAAQTKEDVAKKLDGMTINIGVGNAYPELYEMRKSLKEAEQALKIAKLFSKPKPFCLYRDLDLYTLLLNIKDERILEAYYQDTVGQIVEYDRINSSELLNTLEMFLNENCNITTTAEKMFIHRNTLKYRINKIEDISSCDLRELKDMMKLEIGLMIGRYIKKLP